MKELTVAAKFMLILFLSGCFVKLGSATSSIKILGINPQMTLEASANTLVARGYDCELDTFITDRYHCVDSIKTIVIDEGGIFYNSFSFGGFGKTSKEIASALRAEFDLPPPIVWNVAGFERETRFWIFDDGGALLINTKNVIAEGMSSLHYWSKKRLDVRSDIKASKKAFEEAQSPLTFE